MTDAELREIEQRCEAAGDYEVGSADQSEHLEDCWEPFFTGRGRPRTEDQCDVLARFVNRARTDIPRLIEEIRLLRIKIKDLEEGK